MVEPVGRLPFANLRVAHQRRGSLVIECVIAAALIATATLALTRLAHQTTKLNHQADNRLAAKLVAENFMERAKDSDAEQLDEEAAALAEAMSTQYESKITATTDRFKSGDRQGTHLQIEVVTSPNARVIMHDWRLIQADNPNAASGVRDDDSGDSETGNEDSDNEDSDNEDSDNEDSDNEDSDNEDSDNEDAGDDAASENQEDNTSSDESESESNDESSSSNENEAERDSASGGSDDAAE